MALELSVAWVTTSEKAPQSVSGACAYFASASAAEVERREAMHPAQSLPEELVNFHSRLASGTMVRAISRVGIKYFASLLAAMWPPSLGPWSHRLISLAAYGPSGRTRRIHCARPTMPRRMPCRSASTGRSSCSVRSSIAASISASTSVATSRAPLANAARS